ncbi:glucoamylase family protein [Tundrisphaera sp. TA3]|uniref:glucoamylase family protein n=1 Tax=Tundrisphaera sp. TA3 TaxID=3435775 RepID=UPI003EC0B01D
MTPNLITDSHLDMLQWVSLIYYLRETNPDNGLVADKTAPGSPSSIAAVGMALSTAPVVVERGIMERDYAINRVLTKLRFFRDSKQGPEPDATGYRGFYYHFLDMETGRRVWDCELSTIDSGFLIAGILTAATYFDRDTADEREIREIADFLYRRVDWQWAANGGAALTHGWRPETGFIPYRWTGYDEALLLYLLALGSPTYPLPAESYAAYCATYQWRDLFDVEMLYSGPLFTHQLSHLWIDFRGIQDAFMREHRLDYFENSRRATYLQRDYAIRNPLGMAMYGEFCWGFTACDGPGWIDRKVDGVDRRFYDYVARGVPFGPDDGTIAPWAVVASLPFAPEIVLPTIYNFYKLDLGMTDDYGFKTSFNPTYPVEGSQCGWVSPYYFGIDQGPLALMIENYRTGLLWTLMKRCPPLLTGLRRAGFTGGWL